MVPKSMGQWKQLSVKHEHNREKTHNVKDTLFPTNMEVEKGPLQDVSRGPAHFYDCWKEGMHNQGYAKNSLYKTSNTEQTQQHKLEACIMRMPPMTLQEIRRTPSTTTSDTPNLRDRWAVTPAVLCARADFDDSSLHPAPIARLRNVRCS